MLDATVNERADEEQYDSLREARPETTKGDKKKRWELR